MLQVGLVGELYDFRGHGPLVAVMRRMMLGAGQIRSPFDRLAQSETSFDVTIVVAVNRDDAAEDQEVGDRPAEA